MKMMKRLSLKVSQLPNGYALEVGKHEYMFYTAEDFIEGLFYHFGLQELEYVDSEDIHALVQSIALWQTEKKAFKAARDMMQQNKELMHKLRIAQATISDLRRRCDALRERIESRKK